MNLFRSLLRSGSPLPFDDWVNYFTFNGLQYPFGLNQTMGYSPAEEISGDFIGLTQAAYKSNGVVFACMLARQLVFSEARFQFRRLDKGRPGKLFGTKALERLETPWPNGTTGDLLTRMLQDADLEGNFYAASRDRYLARMRPDWVTILLGSKMEPDSAGVALDAEVIGYFYHPGGPGTGDPITLLPNQVAHFAPIPDPEFRFRGMSWLTPIIREIMGDAAATTHKLKFFENGATVNLVVTVDANTPDGKTMSPDQFQKWVDVFEDNHKGIADAYKTLYLGGGADVKPVGADLKQVDFKVTQGAGETRIAAAARIPPVIVGLSEGLEASTYSNYGQARRAFADLTMRPLWRHAAGALAPLVRVPDDAELWYDDRDIPFLQEDQKDAAEIQGREAQTIRQLIDAGYTPDSAVAAVMADNWSLLEHTGMFSVQLHPPGQGQQPTDPQDDTEPQDD